MGQLWVNLFYTEEILMGGGLLAFALHLCYRKFCVSKFYFIHIVFFLIGSVCFKKKKKNYKNKILI